MHQAPLYDDTVPIVCTIGDDEVHDRVALIERLRGHVTAVERTDHGLLLRFPAHPEIDADVRRFAADEHRCCRFWGFAVDARDADLTLRWDGPPAAGDLLDQLAEQFRGDRPITAVPGLL
jgi:hypothetical protein